jgi:histidinol phosphatase-like PHP family hydrolase
MDINALVADAVRDLAAIQTSRQKQLAYERAAAAIYNLDAPLDTRLRPDGTIEKIAGVGPSTTRVALEVLRTGASAIVDRAVAESGRAADIVRRRALRAGFLSRAEALRVLDAPGGRGLRRADYRGDLQMHSEWSDGRASLEALAAGGMARGYAYIGVTDHSHGLPIARGMSLETVARQHAAIDRLNTDLAGRFRIIKGVEANIAADGALDLSADERQQFELVLAAPHAKLRQAEDQTLRMLTAVALAGVHILAHPRGRISGTRAGVIADWDRIFDEVARRGIAIEIDGDPARQDLDHVLAQRALAAGCLFALDSDAHGPDELAYADTAMAQARLAGIPAARIVNCWPLDRLLPWLASITRPGTGRPAPPRSPAPRPRRRAGR